MSQAEAIKATAEVSPGAGSTPREDPLLDALVVVARLLSRPVSTETLRAGLPLVDHRLSVELFPRAARRAGLSAKLVRRGLDQLPDLLLPAVLLLDDGRTCVLTARDEAAGSFTVIWPETETGQATLERAELERVYRGYAFLVKAAYVPEERASASGGTSSRHWFWGVLRRSWRVYRDVLAASLLVNLFALATPLYIMTIYDRVVPNQAQETLWVLSVAVAGVYLFEVLMRGLRGYFLDLAAQRSEQALSAVICERMLGLRMAARPGSVGGMANQVAEFERLRDFIAATSMTTLIDLPFMLVFLLLIYWIAGPLVVVPLVALPLMLLYGLAIQPALRRAVGEVMKLSAQKHATLVESLAGQEALKILGGESVQQGRWELLTGQLSRWGMRARQLSASSTLVGNLLRNFVWLASAIGGVYLVIEGELTQGGLIAVLILTGRAMAPLTQVAGLAARYNQAAVSLRTLTGLMELPQDRPEGRTYVHHDRLAGRIEFQECTFSYPEQGQPAVERLDLQIEPGERIGIIGAIGSGKTTIGKLLLGLYEPGEGAVRVDGFDLRQFDPAILRRNIGCASQDVFLFRGTLRENLAMGTPWAEDDAILRAAEMAGVAEFAARHPHGFDMQIGERGERLSGGQRQAVSVARALLLEPPILLLDEPTSFMDNASEARLKEGLKGYVSGRTVIIITHRASLLELVDRLVVMDHGRLIADGKRDEILEALRQGRLRPPKPGRK
ncbi:MAG TPA: type I secretion system permease/ATPase [Gammaproteobacteria bacterium]